MAERLFPNITILVEAAIFLVLLFVLAKFLFKPVIRILEERRKRIEGAKEEARKLELELKIILDRYHTEIGSAREEARKTIEELRKEGEEIAKGIVEKAKKESEQYFADSKKKVWEEAQSLKKRLESTAQEVSDELAGKIFQ
jgi:F-type H+-transporting ATPase subunit b